MNILSHVEFCLSLNLQFKEVITKLLQRRYMETIFFTIALIFLLLININYIFAFVPVIILGLILIIIKPEARFLYLIMGGLLIFQNASGNLKVLYLAGLVIILFVAFKNIDWKNQTVQLIKPVIKAGLLLQLYLVISMIVSIIKGYGALNTIRDSVQYIILAFSPIFAVDFAINIRSKHLNNLVLSGMLLGSILCIVGWISRRGYTDADLIVGLSSYSLPAALFSISIANFMSSKRFNITWLILAVAVLGGTIMTGTRSSYAFLFAPIAILLFSKAKKTRIVPILIFGVAFGSWVFSFFMNNTSQFEGSVLISVQQRIQYTAESLINNSITDDSSYMERVNQTEVALSTVTDNPLFGAGPGKQYIIQRYNGVLSIVNSLDSPMFILAKYGIIGLIILIIFLGLIYKHLITKYKYNVYSISLLAFLGVCLAWLPLVNPFDDKGSGLVIIMLMASILNNISENKSTLECDDLSVNKPNSNHCPSVMRTT